MCVMHVSCNEGCLLAHVGGLSGERILYKSASNIIIYSEPICSQVSHAK